MVKYPGKVELLLPERELSRSFLKWKMWKIHRQTRVVFNWDLDHLKQLLRLLVLCCSTLFALFFVFDLRWHENLRKKCPPNEVDYSKNCQLFLLACLLSWFCSVLCCLRNSTFCICSLSSSHFENHLIQFRFNVCFASSLSHHPDEPLMLIIVQLISFFCCCSRSCVRLLFFCAVISSCQDSFCSGFMLELVSMLLFALSLKNINKP